MQAVGLINGHVPGCVIRRQVDHARSRFKLPEIGAQGRRARTGTRSQGANA